MAPSTNNRQAAKSKTRPKPKTQAKPKQRKRAVKNPSSLVRPEKKRTKQKIGRLLRKALGKPRKETDDVSGQQTLFFITTTMSNFESRPLHPKLFEPPASCEDS